MVVIDSYEPMPTRKIVGPAVFVGRSEVDNGEDNMYVVESGIWNRLGYWEWIWGCLCYDESKAAAVGIKDAGWLW